MRRILTIAAVAASLVLAMTSIRPAKADPQVGLIDEDDIVVLEKAPLELVEETEHSVLAQDEGKDADDPVMSVTDFGARGDDDRDDYAGFKRALEVARDTTGITVVQVPEGTYYLANSVPIYSNTTLEVSPNATIISTSSGGIMVFSRHLNEDGTVCTNKATCAHGGYSQIENVTIDGGTWDANYGPDRGASEVFQFRHGRNITIKNAVCKNAYNHFINISGVDTALVDNVTCEDMATYTGNGDEEDFWGTFKVGDKDRYKTIEAIHIDYLEARGEGRAYPLDGTASQNVRISNCTFRNVYAGLGTHHYSTMGSHASNLEVDHNVFESLMGGSCINAYDFANLCVHDNTASTGNIFLNCKRSTQCEVTNNSISAMSDTPLYFSDGSEANVHGNIIADAAPFGIRARTGSKITISGNDIRGARTGTHGIYLSEDSSGTIEDNTISSCTTSGVVIKSAPSIELANNTIGAVGEHGIHIADSGSVTVRNNNVTAPQKKGLVISACSEPSVQNNTVSSPGDVGIAVSDCANATVSNNTVNSPGGNGVNVYNSDNATIRENTVSDSKEIGIKLHCTKGSVARGNAVEQCTGNGIQVSGDANCTSTVDLIDNTSLSAKATSGCFDIRLTEHCDDCTLDNNTIGSRGFSAHKSVTFVETKTKLGADILMSNCKVSLASTTVTYVGTSTAPEVDVTFFSSKLACGTDYTVKSTFDFNKLTATATITGKGHLSGSKSVAYKILPGAPTLKKATNVVGGIKVTWAASKGAAKYRVMRKVGSGKWAKVADVTGTSYTDKKVASGKKYTYTVRCLSKAGKTYDNGYDTKGKSRTYVAAPVIKAVAKVKSGIKVTWAASKGAAKYRVMRKVGSGKWAKVADVTGTSYTDKKVASGKKYTYTVRCLSKDGKTFTSAYNTKGKALTYRK